MWSTTIGGSKHALIFISLIVVITIVDSQFINVSYGTNLVNFQLFNVPIGGIYLKHAANVIVHFKEFSKTSGIPSLKATLIKHQYTKTPKSAAMYVRKAGGMMLLD
jgi:hypothetical protein